MSPRVVVVGGGLAGMAAALRAADAGAEVTLVERRRRLGGLTWSFERKGMVFDNGQHVFLRCCTEYRTFLHRIGAAAQVRLQDRLSVPVLRPGHGPARIARTGLPLPAPLHLGPSLLAYAPLGPADRLRLGRAVLGLRRLRLDDPRLDHETFGAWLARHGQGPEAIDALWDLVTLPTVNVGATEASLAMAAKVFRTGLLDDTDGGDIGWSTVPLGVLHGENGERALARAGVEAVLGEVVRSVAPAAGPGRAGGVTVTTASRTIGADAAVVALPHEAAPGVLPTGALPAVEGLGHSPIVNVHLVLDRRVTDLPFAAAVRSPVQFVFDRTEASGAPAGAQTLVVSLSAADRWVGVRPQELVTIFLRALGDLLPSARRASVVDAVVSRERTATMRAVPGTGPLRPDPAGTLPGAPGVYVAGAWCDTGWPATMESAVRAGRAAANGALAFTSPGALTAAPRLEGATA